MFALWFEEIVFIIILVRTADSACDVVRTCRTSEALASGWPKPGKERECVCMGGRCICVLES